MNKVLAALIGNGNAQWDLNPDSSDWNTATNWTPTTVPNGAANMAAATLPPCADRRQRASDTIMPYT